MENLLDVGEKHLLILLKQKNENAINYLYDKYAALLYGIILGQVKNEKTAATILQAAFVAILKECTTIDCVKQSLFTWMVKMTKMAARENFSVDIDLTSLIHKSRKSGCYSSEKEKMKGQFTPASFQFVNNTN